jgi:hypothetical protein
MMPLWVELVELEQMTEHIDKLLAYLVMQVLMEKLYILAVNLLQTIALSQEILLVVEMEALRTVLLINYYAN